MKRMACILIWACLALSPTLALADAPSSQDDQQKRAQIEARMKQLRSDMLKKDVGLSTEKLAQAEKILQRYAEERKKLKAQIHTQHRAISELLDSGNNDDAAYAKAVKNLRALDTRLMALRGRELDEVSRLMTPKQQAKFMVAVRKMQHRLREALRAYHPNDD
jgi:Spy/CpxP family protein refolding chaperone